MDVFTPEKRSEIMSKIRSKNTTLEKRGFLVLAQAGLRCRKHPKGIFGKPDAANASRKIAVFFDSSFWHGRNFDEWNKRMKGPYWKKKIERNIARDKEVNRILRAEGWKVIRIWEYELAQKHLSKVIVKLQKLKKY